MQALWPRRANELRSEIERLVADGASLDQIDRRVAREPLDPELRDALWLYALGRTERRHRPPVPALRLYDG